MSIFNDRKEAIAYMLEHNRIVAQLKNKIERDRPYRTSKGFERWDRMAGVLSGSIFNAVVEGADTASLILAYRCIEWLSGNYPLYVVREPLLRVFEQAVVPIGQPEPLLRGIEIPPMTAMLLFPQGAIATPDGGYIDWAIAQMTPAGDRRRMSYAGISVIGLEVGPPFVANVSWCGCDSRTTNWFSGTNVTKDGRLMSSDAQLGANDVSRQDVEFLAKMRSVCLQAMMAIAFVPELIAEPEPAVRKPSRGQGKSPEYWSPREIRTARRRTKSKGGSGGGSPKRPHFRGAHWRNQACGEGWQEHRLRLILPTKVNKE